MHYLSDPADDGLRPGAPRAVIESALLALDAGEQPTLAMVVDTEGSTYVRPGAIALFSRESGQTGWLSGGCLESEISSRAGAAAQNERIEWMEIDTRDDEDLFIGSALGCRGRLRLALLPLRSIDGWTELAKSWLAGAGEWRISVSIKGHVALYVGAHSVDCTLPSASAPWATEAATSIWILDIVAPPRVLIFGAGPETAMLVPVLRTMGWMVCVIERRPRWRAIATLADQLIEDNPADAITSIAAQTFTAALIMHHNFELDREALEALADTSVAFIGLLGPRRRRDDLFMLLTPGQRERLSARLRSPVGLDLGGRGPEAIALSIAAQLHAHLHGR